MGKLGIADLKDGNHAAEGGGCEIQVHGVLRRLARGGCSHAASGNFRGGCACASCHKETTEVTREIRRWLVENKPCTNCSIDLMPMEWPAGLSTVGCSLAIRIPQ